ncbi:MAG: tetratricopeptide repeat protein [Candidatus Latescibacterota bacterium]|nr:tetratricopeptide repeat protein [Candidatus Latescibacterota bacterium]
MEERSNRPTRAELEEDQFLEWVLTALAYIRARGHIFIGGAVAVVATIAIISFVQQQRSSARTEAAALLFEATLADQVGQIDGVLRVCERLVDDFGNTPAAAQATVMLGNRYFALGRYAEAERSYQRYLDDYGDEPVLRFAAESGIAAGYEAQGNFEQAAAAYVDYATRHPEIEASALMLMDAARCHRQLGDRDRERSLLERVMEEFPQSSATTRARQELGALM